VGGERFGWRMLGSEAKRSEEGTKHRHCLEALCEAYVGQGCQLAALESEGERQEAPPRTGLKSREIGVSS